MVRMRDAPNRMPAIFIGHGTPLNALRDNRWTRAWRRLGLELARPRSILAISGHWCTRGTHATAMAKPPTIHDFYGFPPELHRFTYPAVGDPELVTRVRDLLHPIPIHPDSSWGLDHGTWVVLSKIFPLADVPVVQLSLDMTKPASEHFEMGRRLRLLRDEGVLILGSGNVVHNLRARVPDRQQFAYDWAERFNTHIRNAIITNQPEQVINYDKLGLDAMMAVPSPDHFYPLLYVVGASGDDKACIEIDGIERGAVGMLSVLYGRKLTHRTAPLMADAEA
jgi:4,5-DOPA dioxygenase extradiol